MSIRKHGTEHISLNGGVHGGLSDCAIPSEASECLLALEFIATARAFGVTGTAELLSREGDQKAVTHQSAGGQDGEGAAVLRKFGSEVQRMVLRAFQLIVIHDVHA